MIFHLTLLQYPFWVSKLRTKSCPPSQGVRKSVTVYFPKSVIIYNYAKIVLLSNSSSPVQLVIENGDVGNWYGIQRT